MAFQVSARDHDHVHCGTARVAAGWPRLACALASVWIAVVAITALVTDSGGRVDRLPATPPSPGVWPKLAPARPTRHAVVDLPSGHITPFCGSGRQLPASTAEAESALGVVGRLEFLTRSQDTECEWRERTDTQVPFRMCLWDEAHDNQISQVILKSGQWNAAKKELMQAALPTAAQAESVRTQGSLAGRRRRVMIDVGASTGFFSLLAAARGYDVVALEPVREQAVRILASAEGNGFGTMAPASSASSAEVRAAAKAWRSRREGVAKTEETAVLAREADVAAGRDPSVALPHAAGSIVVLRNAASDGSEPMAAHGFDKNPGATSMAPLDGAPSLRGAALPEGATAWSVPLDGLAGLGLFRPDEVAAIKISAEGMDCKVLNGMRALLREGRPPVVQLVFNNDHVTQHGCDTSGLLSTLLQWGYRVYDFGLYRSKKAEVLKMAAGWGQRSTELTLVEQSVRL